MIRQSFLKKVEDNFKVHPAVALLGPRQCGKTTLARQFAQGKKIPPENYFDLEDPTDLLRLENPKTSFGMLSGLVVIDEIQLSPNLFPVLRVLLDRPDNNLTLLILSGASKEFIQHSSETLAGRIGHLELTPFALYEVDAVQDINRLWVRGGFPRSFLAGSDSDSGLWRKNYIRTFLERDLRELGFNVSPQSMR